MQGKINTPSGSSQKGMIQVRKPLTFACLIVASDTSSSHLDVIYPNGISCTMPADVQERMLRSIPGLENVEMIRPGYGVEYDCIDARELRRAL